MPAASTSSGFFTFTQSGHYRWRATYNGDDNYAAKTAPCNDANESVFVTGPLAQTAVDDSYTVAQDSGLTLLSPKVGANDDPSTAGKMIGLTQASHGSTSSNGSGDGVVGYTPAAGYSGQDTFRYAYVEDGVLVSNEATVTITVTPTGTPGQRVAGDDAYTVAQDSGTTTLTPAPLYNDQPELGLANKTFNVTTPAGHGTATITNAPDPDDTTFAYTPDPGFHGTDTFQYRYADADTGDNQSTIATVTITVTPTGGGAEDVVDVGADCSGDVTFTNLLDEEVNVRYGPNVSLEGEFDLGAGQSETIMTDAKRLNFLAANASSSESGSIEIPNCSNGGGDDHDHGDEDDDGDDDHGKGHHGHLPDTGSPSQPPVCWRRGFSPSLVAT